MKESIAENKWFFIPYILTLLVCFYFLVSFSRSDIHIYINHFYNPFADQFFKFLTNLGDGMFLPLFILIMLYIRFRYAVWVIIVFLLSGLVVQIVKRLPFWDSVRPSKFFETTYHLHLVEGVHQHAYHSFPSGHSATAFSILLCFAMVTKHFWVKLGMFLLAASIAFSRVYLSQHFLNDIIAGSIIGVLVTLFSWLWIKSFQSPWLDKNLLTLKQK